ncbi:winged helix-turn-helix domain-containing protein [Caulobacter mirabilis]|nr:winged helix-turn-helix domain-containing protein [Caulobacter mirabilis]
MTEHLAAENRELILAREAPFGLAGTQVRPAALEVEHDGRVAALEPRVMKVLVALARSRGEPVSRDELIELCWGGRIVTEGALNRCTAQLRKALADNPRIRIDTIPTVGYRLQASADLHVHPLGGAGATTAAAADEVDPAPRRLWPMAAAAVAAVAVIGGAAWWWTAPKPVTWTAASYRPITSERGLETHPALSPRGDQLVYAQRYDSSQTRDLYLRGVGPGATPVRLTRDSGDNHSPAWSPRGDRVAFVRAGWSGPCSLVVVPMPLGPERVVGRCQAATYTKVSWLDDETLVISDRPTPSAIRRVRAIDIRTGVGRDLTAPTAETLGDSDPVVSPDGRSIVFRRGLMHGADDLFLKDVRTGRERALTTDGWKAVGYVWSADSRHVFYSTNRGGAFGLWTVDTRRSGPPRRVSLGLGNVSFSRMGADSGNRLAVEAPSGSSNLARRAPDGTVSAVTSSSNSDDWDPTAWRDGTVAYISDRSGASEVWIVNPDGRAVQLTSLVGSYVSAPSWSPDGRDIAFVSVKGRRSEIYSVGRDGSRLRALTDDGADKLSPVYAPAGDRLRYVLHDAGGYRLMELPLAPGARARAVPGGAGWREVKGGPDGRLYGVRGDGVVRAVLGGAEPEAPVRLGTDDSWAPTADGVYVLRARRDSQTPPTAWLHPWTGPARKVTELPFTWGDLSLAPDGSLIFIRDLDEQIDLGLIELTS